MNAYPVPGAVAGLAPMTPTGSAYECPMPPALTCWAIEQHEFVGKVDHQFFPWCSPIFVHALWLERTRRNPCTPSPAMNRRSPRICCIASVDAISPGTHDHAQSHDAVHCALASTASRTARLTLATIRHHQARLSLRFAGQLQEARLPSGRNVDAATNGTSNPLGVRSVYYSRQPFSATSTRSWASTV